MDELELSPDSNDMLMIDEDSHGDDEVKFEHSETELNMDLLDYEDGEEDKKVIQDQPDPDLGKQLVTVEGSALKDPTDKNRNRTPIVFNAVKKDNESRHVSSSSATVSDAKVSSAKRKVDQKSHITKAPTSDFSFKIGLSNVELDFTEEDLKVLKTYHDFYTKYKPVILSGNPTAPMPKINMVVASKWKEFLNFRNAKDVSNRKRASNSSLRVKPASCARGAEVNLQFQRKPNPSLFSNDKQLNNFASLEGRPRDNTIVQTFPYNFLLTPCRNGENRIIFDRPPPSLPLPPSNTNGSYPFASQQINTIAEMENRPVGPVPGYQASFQPVFPTNSPGPKLRFGSPSGNASSSSSFGAGDRSSLQDLFRTRANDMSISDIESLLAKKKKEELIKRQRAEEEAAQRTMNAYDTMNGNSTQGSPSASSPPAQPQVSNLEAMMKQQMEFQRSMMVQMQQQQKDLEKQRREMEAKRQMDELKFDMKKIELMLTMKQGNAAGPVGGAVVNQVHQNPGSVRARVGPKNPLKDESQPPATQRVKEQHMTWSNGQQNGALKKRNACDISNNNNGFKKRKKFAKNDGPLPPELILTNLTEKGPVPAAARIGFGEAEDDTGNWKRRKTVVRGEEDEDIVVTASLSDDED